MVTRDQCLVRFRRGGSISAMQLIQNAIKHLSQISALSGIEPISRRITGRVRRLQLPQTAHSSSSIEVVAEDIRSGLLTFHLLIDDSLGLIALRELRQSLGKVGIIPLARRVTSTSAHVPLVQTLQPRLLLLRQLSSTVQVRSDIPKKLLLPSVEFIGPP
jgi:hypothetical protein